MGCSSSKPSFVASPQGTPGSLRALAQMTMQEATSAAIRAEVARVKALPAEERSMRVSAVVDAARVCVW